MLSSSSTSMVKTAPPIRRADRRRRRFTSALIEGLRSTEGLSVLGKDKNLGRTLQSFADIGHEISVHRIAVAGTHIAIIGIPNAVWYSKRTMRSLKSVIGLLTSRGHRIAAVPQRAVEALGKPGAPQASAFFRLLVEQALLPLPDHNLDCAYSIAHEPTGCFAMKLATGSPCHH